MIFSNGHVTTLKKNML